MKTRMEKRISISTITVLALVLMLVLGTVLVDHDLAWAKKPAPNLKSTIDYWFAGHLGITDGEGRLLVWDGTISGDLEGEIKYWFYPGFGPKVDTANSTFYTARWEIWDGGTLLLAGESAGQTATPPGKDGIWRGNGIVTEAYGDFTDWIGRHIYEGGNVNWDFPYSGSGVFRIN